MDRITEITEAVFNALGPVQRREGVSVPNPELVHQQLCTYIDQVARAGQKLGLSADDIDDIRYALVALADEVVLNKNDALRDFWVPRMLQLRYFKENVAGEIFFGRLEALRKSPSRTDALKVYYLCLLFGFRGKYRVRGGEVELLDITDAVREQLLRQRALPSDITLSPAGLRPYEPAADARRNQLLIWLALGAAISSVLLYLGMRLNLLRAADQLVERLGAIAFG
jgi:type VI secretion system protein ImpK